MAPEALLVGLVGSSEGDRQAVAAAACTAMNLRVFRLRAADLPIDPFGRSILRERWERERKMHPFALLVELDRESASELVRSATALLADLGGLAFVSSREPVCFHERATPRSRSVWRRASSASSA